MTMRCILKVGHPEPCVFRESSETLYLTPDMCRKAKLGWQCKKCSKLLTNRYCVSCEDVCGVELPTEFVDVSVSLKSATSDMVNHPPHYKAGGIEVIDFIEAKSLGFHEGNVVKYVARAKFKGKELEDLKKARWYLDRAITRLEE